MAGRTAGGGPAGPACLPPRFYTASQCGGMSYGRRLRVPRGLVIVIVIVLRSWPWLQLLWLRLQEDSFVLVPALPGPC